MKQSIDGNLLRVRMMKFDWIKILETAIRTRQSSWNNGYDAVREWRNASDEICMAVIHAMEDDGLVPDMFGRCKGLKPIRKH